MATDWAADVRKYAAAANDAHIAGIVRHCGIALTRPDAALVSFSDPAETGRVRESFLKRKLALTATDADLDAAIAAVGVRMKASRRKNRVTVYYLLAEHFDKLALFEPAAKKPRGAAAVVATVEPMPVAAKTKRAPRAKAAVSETPAEVTGAVVGTVSAAVGGEADAGAVAGSTVADMAVSVGAAIADAAEAVALKATGAVPSVAAALADPLQTARNDHIVHGGSDAGADVAAKRDVRWMLWLVAALVVLLVGWWIFAH